MFSSVRQRMSRKRQQLDAAKVSLEGQQQLKRLGWHSAKGGLALILLFVAAFMWSNLDSPLSLPGEYHGPSQVVIDANGQPLSAVVNNQGYWRYPVNIDQISPLLIEALSAQHQSVFAGVIGFDPLTVKTAELFFPQAGMWQSHVRTLQLELAYSKDEIMALYLNHVRLGGKIEGVQAASYQFFDKPALALEHHEVALLLALAKYPKRYRLDKFADRAKVERDQLINEFGDEQLWTQKQVNRALGMPVATVSLALPQIASQYASKVMQDNDETVIRSNIDAVIQAELERYSQEFADKQVNGSSMAMLMMDNQTKQVIAYVGNSPGHDSTDMVQAMRSPGDMLKPLVFGKALDERLIHSESLLADVPRRGYLRDVADGFDEFIGPVSASEALQMSLNVPFVQLIENIGEKKFLKSLAAVGQPLELSDFGLSPRVLLGEAETNLAQMVQLYASFGSQGNVAPLQYLPAAERPENKRFMSAESAWITWNTLREAPVPEYVLAPKPAVLGWKAGSGWASRDNWAIGVTPSFTLGIWVGVHDDIYSSPVSGRDNAVASLIAITAAMEEYRPLGKLSRPRGVKQEEICWPDGRSRGVNLYGCDRRKTAWTKNGDAPRTLLAGQGKGWFRSQKGMYVDSITEKRLSRGCYKNRAEYTTATLWPRVLEPWLPERMRRAKRLPDFNDYCPNIPMESNELVVTGIAPQQVFHRINNKRLPPLMVQASSANGDVEWYLNGESIADGNLLELNLNRLVDGPQQLVALDEKGYSLQIPFEMAKALPEPVKVAPAAAATVPTAEGDDEQAYEPVIL
ncbi:transglycosylase domain-containing protein [uncultured Ferrimonas sp.]|uniref:transglycosylase domain-containing protein n=1 Tax=uncultured Ferrimonas sp. TaxID=432640 RepID=UPI00261AE797|nr:transglycosylase domain-containing protein [uncultured Ferrimonas sp.]